MGKNCQQNLGKKIVRTLKRRLQYFVFANTPDVLLLYVSLHKKATARFLLYSVLYDKNKNIDLWRQRRLQQIREMVCK
jgi:hypothetical protein